MKVKANIILFLTVTEVMCVGKKEFPDSLRVGFASSCYQMEGAWNTDGKGENIWDRLLHTRPEVIEDGSNGDIANDSYHLYKQDVELLKIINAQVYRFSLSWSRILPTGESNIINQPGVDYYNNLINELIANNIEPMVNLYVWDLPQPLQDIGGWTNPLMADYFGDFARVAFDLFGDKVKVWMTINEPYEVAQSGYGDGTKAPMLPYSGTRNYLAGHTLLLAHARAYHIYDEEYRQSQRGVIGIVSSGGHYVPKTNSTLDVEAAETAFQFDIGWFAHPIFSSEGDYPAVMKRNIDTNSQNEGRPRSRLPVFTPDQVQYIRGTSDFFAINHYTSNIVESGGPADAPSPSMDRDKNVTYSYDPSWGDSASDWLKVVPWGFRKLLERIRLEYKSQPHTMRDFFSYLLLI